MQPTHTTRRRALIALGVSALVATATVIAACGGGSDNKDKTSTAASGSPTKSAVTGTPRAGTPGATGTAGTPGAGTTPGAPGSTPGATNGTPGAVNPQGTPVPGSTTAINRPEPGAVSSPLPGTGQNGADPVSEAEATFAAEADPSISGGDPTAPQQTVGNVPDPPPGATIDSRTIASTNFSGGGVEVIIDLNASAPGIQSTRDVKVGDIIRVGVIVTNAPSITALGFDLNYDHTKAVAPTIINGPSTDRNPDLNLPALGGAEANWLCSPSPVGDRDEAGIDGGDGNPSTGQAYLGCFTPAFGHESGTIVVATIEFRATASGSSQLSLFEVSVFDDSITQFARCEGDAGGGDAVPCQGATLNVQ